MKVGDVVELKENYQFADGAGFGIIIDFDTGPDGKDSWIAYLVQWNTCSLWHGGHELELISEGG